MSIYCENAGGGVPPRLPDRDRDADQKRLAGASGDEKGGVLAPSVTVTWARQSAQPGIFAVKEAIGRQMSRVSTSVFATYHTKYTYQVPDIEQYRELNSKHP